MNEDEILRAFIAELKAAHFSEFIQQLSDDYERTEHELAWGLEIQDPQARADHERIKAKIQTGYSLADAVIKWVLEQHVKRFEEEHGPTAIFRTLIRADFSVFTSLFLIETNYVATVL